jgi:hypothetical protein
MDRSDPPAARSLRRTGPKDRSFSLTKPAKELDDEEALARELAQQARGSEFGTPMITGHRA